MRFNTSIVLVPLMVSLFATTACDQEDLDSERVLDEVELEAELNDLVFGDQDINGPSMGITMNDVDAPQWPIKGRLLIERHRASAHGDIPFTRIHVSWPKAVDENGIASYAIMSALPDGRYILHAANIHENEAQFQRFGFEEHGELAVIAIDEAGNHSKPLRAERTVAPLEYQ